MGDPKQLPEIDAGGLFTALTRRLPAIELDDNRRQTHQWEQATLDQLRHGNPEQAVHDYAERGRLVTADSVDDIRTRLVTDWWHAFDPDQPDAAVMVALRRADVDDLNVRARAHMAAAGRLAGPTLTLDDGTVFQAGDRVVCLRNDRAAGLVNGLRATVADVHADATLTVVDDHGTDHTIPTSYLDAGHIAHGYAITGHKAQGLTVDHTFVLGSDALYREWGYVAMSRGRRTNQLYVHTTDDIQPDAHLRPAPVDRVAATVTRLSRSHAEQPIAPTLGQQLGDLDQFLVSPAARRARPLHDQQRRLTEQHQHLQQRREHLEHQVDRQGLALSRRARADRRQLEADLDHVTSRLSEVHDHRAQINRALIGLPTRDDLDDALGRHRELTRDLDRPPDASPATPSTGHPPTSPTPSAPSPTTGTVATAGATPPTPSTATALPGTSPTPPTPSARPHPPIPTSATHWPAHSPPSTTTTPDMDHTLDHDITRGFGRSR